jgi:glycine/D-amino acid oxidase-like deaminating enzyme
MKPIDLDVLIIGGGVMGLWLLNDLRQQGYAGLLVERRELGGEQTCHSHVYLHQGYLYQERDVVLAIGLNSVTLAWQHWIGLHTPRQGVTPSYFGFPSQAEADERVRLWTVPSLGLTVTSVDPSAVPALRRGTVRVVLQTREICLDGEALVQALTRNVNQFISRIDEVYDIRVKGAGDAVEEVVVVLPGGARLPLRPKALVLTAGSGNQALLDRLSGGRRALLGRVRNAQQVRKSHMLVVRGTKADLPPLTGVFPSHGGLFIVSRDLGAETVWLISDNRGPSVAFVEDWMAYDARWWLAPVWANLRELAPACFINPERLCCGIYEAPKAEGRASGFIPHQERIEQFGMPNLWAVWPTKLTLAPKASREVMDQIGKLIPPPGASASTPAAWSASRVPADIAPERWKKTPLVPWDAFRRAYNL